MLPSMGPCRSILTPRRSVPTGPLPGIRSRPGNAADFSLSLWKPRPVGHASSSVQVSCGAKHVLAVTADGHLLAWGDNRYGQCGLPFGPSAEDDWPGGDNGDDGTGSGGGGKGKRTSRKGHGIEGSGYKDARDSEEGRPKLKGWGREQSRDSGSSVVLRPTQVSAMTPSGGHPACSSREGCARDSAPVSSVLVRCELR